MVKQLAIFSVYFSSLQKLTPRTWSPRNIDLSDLFKYWNLLIQIFKQPFKYSIDLRHLEFKIYNTAVDMYLKIGLAWHSVNFIDSSGEH